MADVPAAELAAVHKAVREGEQVRPVLAGVDLVVRRGEAVAVTGRSGSGKSTLLNVLAGLDAADGGRVLLDGEELARLGEDARTRLRRRHLGFVFQAFHLLPTLTVLENVLLPLELAQRLDATGRERARALLQRVGLAGREQAWPAVLSGGERQRVALARALVHEPALVLADEPTGNLDDDTAAAVLALLGELRREHGTALLLMTHAAVAAASCDRVLVLDHGHLVPKAAP